VGGGDDVRRGPHHIGTTGASDGDALLLDADTDEYVPGDVVLEIVEGTGVTVDATDPKRPVVSTTGGGGGAAREVLMASGVSFPAEPLESSDGGDWLYGEA
jgi:hypothetical protein